MYIDVSMISFGKVASIFLVNFWKRGDTFTIQYFVIFGKILLPILYSSLDFQEAPPPFNGPPPPLPNFGEGDNKKFGKGGAS